MVFNLLLLQCGREHCRRSERPIAVINVEEKYEQLKLANQRFDQLYYILFFVADEKWTRLRNSTMSIWCQHSTRDAGAEQFLPWVSAIPETWGVHQSLRALLKEQVANILKEAHPSAAFRLVHFILDIKRLYIYIHLKTCHNISIYKVWLYSLYGQLDPEGVTLD